MALDAQSFGPPAERFPQVAVAGQGEYGIGEFSHHLRHGLHQEAMSFVLGQRGDGQQQRLPLGQSQRPAAARPVAGADPCRIDAVVHEAEHILGQAVSPADLGDRRGDAHHAVAEPAIFFRRSDGEIHPPGGHPRRYPQSRRGQAGAGDGVRVVVVQHGRSDVSERAANSPQRRGIPPAAGKSEDLESLVGHSPGELPSASSEQRAPPPPPPQAHGQQPGLLFPAVPATLRGDQRDGRVDRGHGAMGSGRRVGRRFGHRKCRMDRRAVQCVYYYRQSKSDGFSGRRHGGLRRPP